ncbi:MAG: GTPase, partial [Gammaproteobacteria bacterium]
MSKLSNLFSDWKFWKRRKSEGRSRFENLQDYTGRVLNPSVDAEDERVLKTIHASLPAPVFWLLGKSQSGKSAIIRALTHSSAAEVGNGFRPCTRTAMLFDFPDAETAFLRFLDTRGLSEAGYDAGDDMRWCEQQAHVLIVVVKSMDHQLDAL